MAVSNPADVNEMQRANTGKVSWYRPTFSSPNVWLKRYGKKSHEPTQNPTAVRIRVPCKIVFLADINSPGRSVLITYSVFCLDRTKRQWYSTRGNLVKQ